MVVSLNPRDTIHVSDFRDPALQPVEGLIGPGLIVLAHPPDLVHHRNYLVEQLARYVTYSGVT